MPLSTTITKDELNKINATIRELDEFINNADMEEHWVVTDCTFSCSGTCFSSCSGGCKGDCEGGCKGTCTGGCSGGVTIG